MGGQHLAAPQRAEFVQQLFVRQRRHLHGELAAVADKGVRPLAQRLVGPRDGDEQRV